MPKLKLDVEGFTNLCVPRTYFFGRVEQRSIAETFRQLPTSPSSVKKRCFHSIEYENKLCLQVQHAQTVACSLCMVLSLAQLVVAKRTYPPGKLPGRIA
jgi:hypothetical protein